MTLILTKNLDFFDGRIFVRGQTENPFCSKKFKTLEYDEFSYRFTIPYSHCNVRFEEPVKFFCPFPLFGFFLPLLNNNKWLMSDNFSYFIGYDGRYCCHTTPSDVYHAICRCLRSPLYISNWCAASRFFFE